MSTPVRCACVDIGSNTTRLLVAEPGEDGRLREILARRVFTRLGSALGPDREIPPDTVAEIADVVAQQVGLARAAGAHSVRVVATAAIREASNRGMFSAVVLERAGVPVQVLTGEQEARLAFAGATGSLLDCPDGIVGVVDVGGRSSELVAGTRAEGVTWAASLPLGSSLLTDAYLHGDPPASGELAAAREHVTGALAGLTAPRLVAAYAVGGSATSLRKLLGPVFDGDALAHGLEELARAPRAEVAARFGLHPERVRLLPAAVILLEGAVGAFGAPLRTCGGGLREGVLLEELGAAEGPGAGI